MKIFKWDKLSWSVSELDFEAFEPTAHTAAAKGSQFQLHGTALKQTHNTSSGRIPQKQNNPNKQLSEIHAYFISFERRIDIGAYTENYFKNMILLSRTQKNKSSQSNDITA